MLGNVAQCATSSFGRRRHRRRDRSPGRRRRPASPAPHRPPTRPPTPISLRPPPGPRATLATQCRHTHSHLPVPASACCLLPAMLPAACCWRPFVTLCTCLSNTDANLWRTHTNNQEHWLHITKFTHNPHSGLIHATPVAGGVLGRHTGRWRMLRHQTAADQVGRLLPGTLLDPQTRSQQHRQRRRRGCSRHQETVPRTRRTGPRRWRCNWPC